MPGIAVVRPGASLERKHRFENATMARPPGSLSPRSSNQRRWNQIGISFCFPKHPRALPPCLHQGQTSVQKLGVLTRLEPLVILCAQFALNFSWLTMQGFESGPQKKSANRNWSPLWFARWTFPTYPTGFAHDMSKNRNCPSGWQYALWPSILPRIDHL